MTGNTPGTHVNTSGNLTSSSGNSGAATNTLTVNTLPVPAVDLWWLALLGGLLGTVALWQLQFRS